MKDLKIVLFILLGVAFVGGMGAWLSTVSLPLMWVFFVASVYTALDFTMGGPLSRAWNKK